MALKNIMYISVAIRMCIVVLGMGLVFFKCVKSFEAADAGTNEALPVMINPMLEAAASGNYDKIVTLLHNGASPNVIDHVGSSSYSLVDRSPESLNNVGNSAFAFVVWNGTYPVNQKCIDLMLHHQANVRLKNKEGQPPHFWVVKIDYKDLRMNILGKLIKFGADINDKDSKAYTLLEKVVETYDTIGVDMLLDWWGKLINPRVLQAAKERAIQYNLGDVLAVLNKKRIMTPAQNEFWDPAAIDKRTGMNDLHYAVINGDTKLLQACIEKKASVNKASEDEFGMRPLHYAVLHYHPDMVEYLISKKADVNGTNLYGNSPLHMIAWLGNTSTAQQIANILLKHGANINAKDQDGNTLLHILVYDNNKDLIEKLGQQYELDVRTQNKDRESVADLAKRLNREKLLVGIKTKK